LASLFFAAVAAQVRLARVPSMAEMWPRADVDATRAGDVDGKDRPATAIVAWRAPYQTVKAQRLMSSGSARRWRGQRVELLLGGAVLWVSAH